MKKITFATNIGPDTLEYTKLLVKSLKENLDGTEHELLFFVDNDTDNTLDYLKSIKKDFYKVTIIRHKLNPIVGPERNINLIVDFSSNDIVSYLQTDMVISKHYDTDILMDLEEDCILSSTRIEPPLHGVSDKTITKNFGLTPYEFDWDSFLKFADEIKENKSIEYFFAPFTFYKDSWKKLGGFDTIFRRSRCDSDLVQRCLLGGIKLKQTFSANVYHFTCVSSRGKNWYNLNDDLAKKRVELQNNADSIELRKFVRKWGSFNHGDSKLIKFDIDLVVVGNITNNYKLIYDLEPFFSRVWFNNTNDRDNTKNLNLDENEYANILYNFKSGDWDKSKIFYNQTDYDSIYKVGAPDKFNIKIEVNFNKINYMGDEFLQNVQNIHLILSEYGMGVYEFGCAKIEILNLAIVSPTNSLIDNPPFDNSLLIVE